MQPEYITLGIFARIATLTKGGMSLEKALQTATDELRTGIALRENGLTKAVTCAQLEQGQLIGTRKHGSPLFGNIGYLTHAQMQEYVDNMPDENQAEKRCISPLDKVN